MALFRPPKRLTRYDVAFVLCVGVSLVASCVLVLHVRSRAGDLVDVFTDHIHHSMATWAFLHRGLDMYRRPFGEMALPSPYFKPAWTEMPVAYPPGMFAIFLVPALLMVWAPLAASTWAKCVVLWIVLLSHLGLIGIWSALSRVKGGVGPLLIVVWVLTLRMSLNGFYDAVWLGCAGMSVAALYDRRPVGSLLWFAAAASMSYRAAPLVPAAILAVCMLARSRVPLPTKVATAVITGAICLLVAWAFWQFAKRAPPQSAVVFRGVSTPFLPVGTRTYVLCALGCSMSLFALVTGDPLVAVTVVITTIFAVLHGGPSWHGSMVVVPALLVGVGPAVEWGRRQHSTLLRNVLAVWFLVVEEFAFQNTPAQFIDLVLRAKLR